MCSLQACFSVHCNKGNASMEVASYRNKYEKSLKSSQKPQGYDLTIDIQVCSYKGKNHKGVGGLSFTRRNVPAPLKWMIVS